MGKVLSFTHDKKNENSILSNYEQEYIGNFETKERFNVIGLPNRTLEITAVDIPIIALFKTR